jgi:hypothetical protein
MKSLGKTFRSHFGIFAALCTLATPAVIGNTIAVSNITQPISHTSVVGVSGPYNFFQTFGFTTGTTAYQLEGLNLSSWRTNEPSGMSVALYTGFTSTGPTGLLTTFSEDAIATNAGIYNFDPVNSTILQPSTHYYVLFSMAPGFTSFSINRTTSQDEDAGGLVGWSIDNTQFWFSNNGGVSYFSNSAKLMASVEVSQVSDSGYSVAFIGAAMAGLMWLRRKLAHA